MEKIILEWGGQGCYLELVKREDGSKYVTFRGKSGYGCPVLEERELETLLKKLKKL